MPFKGDIGQRDSEAFAQGVNLRKLSRVASREADKILVVEQGRITESGTHEEPETLKALRFFNTHMALF